MDSALSAAPAKSPLEMLPVEARQAVMCALPDLASLRSTALTCSSFYHAFNHAQPLITTRVLLNELGPEILPEALAVLESSRVASWTRQEIIDFISGHLSARKPPSGSWTLSEALPIVKLYHHVQYFAGDFVSRSIQAQPFDREAAPPSPIEIARIERAFYRFELYCNLFRDFKHPVLSLRDQRTVFFSKLSPWENEQLACVHDYLVQVVSPAFDEIVEHDIMWGEFRVGYADMNDPGDIEPVLARGLSSIHSIVLANTYQDRYQLFYSDYLQHTYDFLFEALNAANEPNDGIWLEEYTIDDELARIRPPFFPDPDTGPADAWRWAHQEESCVQFLNSNIRRPLRRWGYVFWNRNRLDEMDIFHAPWEESAESPTTNEESQRQERRKESLERRSEIYMAGGRGWWSFEDESKVVWPDGKGPSERPMKREHEQVKSLSEAKEFILLLECP